MKTRQWKVAVIAVLAIVLCFGLFACKPTPSGDTFIYVSSVGYTDDNTVADTFTSDAQPSSTGAKNAVSVSNDGMTIDDADAKITLTVGEAQETLHIGTVADAKIRLLDPVGLRFTTFVKKADYEALATKYGKNNVKVGAIVLPKDFTTDAPTLSSQGLTVYGEKIADMGDGSLRFGAVLTNIAATNYARAFVARSFVEVKANEQTYVAYGAYNLDAGFSPKAVAQAMLVDPASTFTAAETTVLNTFAQEPTVDERTKQIKYHLNGGTATGAVDDLVYGGFTVGEGLTSLTFAPTKAGNTFAGWFTASSGGTQVTSIAATEENNVELWAHWTANTYNVGYTQTVTAGYTLTQGAATATFGTDYSFTATPNNANLNRVEVTVTIGGTAYTPSVSENTYTIAGDAITGDVSIMLNCVNLVAVTYTTNANVTFDSNNPTTVAENGTLTFAATPNTGYKITAVTANDGTITFTAGDNNTYSATVGTSNVTVTVTSAELKYTLVYDNNLGGDKHKTHTVSAQYSYTDAVTLMTIDAVKEQVSGFAPSTYYHFQHWVQHPTGTENFGGSNMTGETFGVTQDNQVVTVYAYWQIDTFTDSTVTKEVYGVAANTVAFPLNQPLGESFQFTVAKDAGYYYTVGYKKNETVTPVTENNGAYTVPAADAGTNVTLVVEKFVVDPSNFDNKTELYYESAFDATTNYTIQGYLATDGIYVRAISNQTSVFTECAEGDRWLITNRDSFIVQIGRKNGEPGAGTNQSNGNSYGLTANANWTWNIDRGAFSVAKIKDVASVKQVHYEMFIPYSRLLQYSAPHGSTNQFFGNGLQESDFTVANLPNLKLNVSFALANKSARTTEGSVLLIKDEQGSIKSMSGNDNFVTLNGNTAPGNTRTISVNGIGDGVGNCDGVISAEEYGNKSITYNDAETNRANKMEVFAKKGESGVKIAVRITSSYVIYQGTGYTIENAKAAADGLRLRFPKGSDRVIIGLFVDESVCTKWGKYSGAAFERAVKIVCPTSYEKVEKNDMRALKATSGKFVTTYEIFMPYGFESAWDKDSDLLFSVSFMHATHGDLGVAAAEDYFMYGSQTDLSGNNDNNVKFAWGLDKCRNDAWDDSKDAYQVTTDGVKEKA